jgi:putative phage-type endonuclease
MATSRAAPEGHACTEEERLAGLIAPPDSLFIEKQGATIHPSLARLLARTNRITQLTKLWFTTRTRMITCSDIAAVVGESPYNTRDDVFRKKTGQSRPFKGNTATRRGQDLEGEALDKYTLKSGKKVWPEDCGLLQHEEHHQIGGSPDGITTDGVVIEIKCPLSREIIPGVMPKLYKGQVQGLMAIANMEEAHFVQYRPAGLWSEQVLDITVVKRDRVYWAWVEPQLLRFMADVTAFYDQKKLPIGTPMIDWSRDDPVARREQDLRVKMGIGRVCVFDGDTFIVEEYTGVNQPVVRTEHKVSTEPATGEDAAVLDMAKQATGAAAMGTPLVNILARFQERGAVVAAAIIEAVTATAEDASDSSDAEDSDDGLTQDTRGNKRQRL